MGKIRIFITAITFEDYSFYEKNVIMSRAKYLVGMHGGGLAHILFMSVGGKVLELHGEIKISEDHHSVFIGGWPQRSDMSIIISFVNRQAMSRIFSFRI